MTRDGAGATSMQAQVGPRFIVHGSLGSGPVCCRSGGVA
jgi:hypothetical protein